MQQNVKMLFGLTPDDSLFPGIDCRLHSAIQVQFFENVSDVRFDDELDRLTGASAAGGSNGLYNESYAYDPVTGNLVSKAGAAYTYDASHPHAASAYNGNTYSYDANGNMTQRAISGQVYILNYDAENRLISVSGPSMNASFHYDGDGQRVKSTINGVITTFVGGYYEQTGSTITKYYYAGAQRVAMRVNGTLSFLFTDHLGSTSMTTTLDFSIFIWY